MGSTPCWASLNFLLIQITQESWTPQTQDFKVLVSFAEDQGIWQPLPGVQTATGRFVTGNGAQEKGSVVTGFGVAGTMTGLELC